MTTPTRAVQMGEETIEEVIGNYACVRMAYETAWATYLDAQFSVDRTRLLEEWNDISTRMTAMELDIRDRMLKDKRHNIDTGKVQARLEFNTRLKNQYSVRLERDGQVL